MRKTGITILILLSTIVIVIVIIAEYNSTRPGKRPANPFAYDVDEFKPVDAELLQWKEARQISLEGSAPRAMAFRKGHIYLVTGIDLQVIAGDWSRVLRKTLPSPASCLTLAEDGRIIIVFDNHLAVLNPTGDVIEQSEQMTGTQFTSVAFYDNNIYVADATGRRVLIFNSGLEQIGEFKGESGVSDIHGFIVPGGHFSLAVNPENELWITNPGLHAMQNYTPNGRLRSYIQNSSFGIEGFSGCCNPVHFTFLSSGEFVTSEKGIIRIKVMKESGEVVSVVATPEQFEGGTRAPALAVDDEGNVLALDFDRNMIRIFEPI